MKTIIYLLLIAFLVIVSGCNREKTMRNDLQSLIESELAFAQASKDKGTRRAFLAFLTDDAILFRPEPVKGRPIYAEKKNDSGLLTWKPVIAEVSLSGDLGFTTGPYEYRKERKNVKADSFGNYLTFWQKQADGKWRVVLDAGIYHSAPGRELADFALPQVSMVDPANSWQKVDVEEEKNKLLKLEQKISNISGTGEMLDTLMFYYSDKIRYYRIGNFPVNGKENVQSKLSAEEGTLTFNPLAAFVAKSGDLGYTYGILQQTIINSKDEILKKSSYLKIWKKQANCEWKVILDLTNPIPNMEN